MANVSSGEDSPPKILVSIPETINEDGVTFYVVSVKVGSSEWTSRRRYKDFLELNETLNRDGISPKEGLPPKKLIGSRDPSFILKRRRELEIYIRSLVEGEDLHRSLRDFLQLSIYDPDYVLKELASSVAFRDGKDRSSRWTPLLLHGISERLKNPRPPSDIGSVSSDFAHLADYSLSLGDLALEGSHESLGTSNILPNNLKFDFVAFRSLTSLHLESLNIKSITSLGNLRETLKRLVVNHCVEVPSPWGILIREYNPEEGNQEFLLKDELKWKKLEHLDLRHNDISFIDSSLITTPMLNSLLLGHNRISEICHLTHLPHLEVLDLSHNDINCAEDLHAKLGQVGKINISNNRITNLRGFSRLFSLKRLSVNGNKIRELECVFPISSLPILEFLNLQGNPVTNVVDYRLKVLECFGKRCPEILLDNEAPTQREVDLVSLLMALSVAREGKSPTSLFGNLPRKV